MVFPGDGRLISVDLDPAFEHLVQLDDGRLVPESVIIAEGLRYWDVVGVPFTPAPVAGAPRLPIRRATAGDIKAGEYLAGEVQIFVYWGERLDATDATWLRTYVAHELGHAMGLPHVAADEAVMNPAPLPLDGLSAPDVEAFRRRWG